jgi:peptidoglycan/xylan/chitin deacetylase (PgdA/CDA1 family)
MVIAALSIAIIYFLVCNHIWRLPYSNSHPRFLMYHTVGDVHPKMSVKPEQFEKQMKLLIKMGYKFHKMSDVNIMNSFNKDIFITFDDGFVDNYTMVFPLIKKYNIPITIYIAPNISDIEKLSSEQIIEMKNSGLVEFGAHSMNHVNLTKLDKEKMIHEIKESKEYIEKITGQKCDSFAYPFGQFNQDVKNAVINSDMKNAVTTKKKVLSSIDNKFEIPRIGITRNMSLLQFYIALTRARYRF